MTLKDLISAVEPELEHAAAYNQQLHASWDLWFAAQACYFRRVIGELIVSSGEGRYAGCVGDHALELGGVFVLSEDGYRGLLVQWLAAAKSALEQRAEPA